MTTYTIKRSDWNGAVEVIPGTSCLYDPRRADHNKCCLGIIAGQLKISDESIAHRGSFLDLDDMSAKGIAHTAKFLAEYENEDSDGPYYADSDLSHRAININDSIALTPEQKEAHLISLFAEHNITLIFED